MMITMMARRIIEPGNLELLRRARRMQMSRNIITKATTIFLRMINKCSSSNNKSLMDQTMC